jgi:spermidine/putrescine transport system permease protein
MSDRHSLGARLVLVGTLLFLYLPIAVLVALSFNSSRQPFTWGGFSTRWYTSLLANEDVLLGLRNTLVVAVGATLLSTVLGTLLAVGLARRRRSAALAGLALTPAVLPDILLAIGLLSFYALIQFSLGLQSILLAHVVFGTAFVTAVVRARLSSLDPSTEEAARDLGATPFQAFRLVTLPALTPGIVAGALLAFTLSLDEFVIAFFTAGPGQATLPIVIYSSVRFGVTPEINALAALLLLVSFTAVLVAQRTARITDAVEPAPAREDA